jgi:hypothetical protein
VPPVAKDGFAPEPPQPSSAKQIAITRTGTRTGPTYCQFPSTHVASDSPI